MICKQEDECVLVGFLCLGGLAFLIATSNLFIRVVDDLGDRYNMGFEPS